MTVTATARALPWQLQQQSQRLELLDAETLAPESLWKNLDELARINTLLGGYAPTLQALQQLTSRPKIGLKVTPWHILDVGCGGGDTLAQIYNWAQQQSIPVKLTGLDLQPDCIAYARKHYGHLPIEWVQSDYAQYASDTSHTNYTNKESSVQSRPDKPDIITSALFCHHLSEAQLQHFLRWIPTLAQVGFVINDLHRHPLAYYGIDLLTRWPGCSHLVKNDARLSVWRGYQRHEWLAALEQAELKATVQWAWAFRWLVVGHV